MQAEVLSYRGGQLYHFESKEGKRFIARCATPLQTGKVYTLRLSLVNNPAVVTVVQ